MANLAETNTKVEPTIIGSVRIDRTVYGPGSEAALAKVITNEQIERLTAAQVIVGFAKTRKGKQSGEGSDETDDK